MSKTIRSIARAVCNAARAFASQSTSNNMSKILLRMSAEPECSRVHVIERIKRSLDRIQKVGCGWMTCPQ